MIPSHVTDAGDDPKILLQTVIISLNIESHVLWPVYEVRGTGPVEWPC